MFIFRKPVTVRRYFNLSALLTVLLLLQVKAYTQWDLDGDRYISRYGTYSYIPTFDGSSNMTYCGTYGYSVIGGYFPDKGEDTYFQDNIDCWGYHGIYEMAINVTWTDSYGELDFWTGDGVYVTIYVSDHPPLYAGWLSPTIQYINFGTSAATITGSSSNGGTGCYGYQWQSSPDGVNWTDITAHDMDYQPTGPLYQTTYFRREDIDNCYYAVAYTDPVTVVVYPQLTCSITPQTQSITAGSTAATLTANGGGGDGSYTYQWQSSQDNSNWTNVGTGSSYNPGVLYATTYYRAIVSSNGVSSNSNTASVKVCTGGPGTITGLNTCVTGSTIKLTTSGSGGNWSSSNPAIAKVDNNGVVTGVDIGSATISYTVSNDCGTSSSQLGVNVVPFTTYSQGIGKGIDDNPIIDTIPLLKDSTRTIQFKQDTLWSSAHSIKNVLALRVIEETGKYIPGDFAATAVVKVEYGHSSASIYQVDSVVLNVNYTKDAGAKYNALNYFTFNNAEFTRFTVLRVQAPTTVNGTSFDTKQVLQLTNTLSATRYYQLADNKRPVLSYPARVSDTIPDALPVSWTLPLHTQNNAVQLEWAWLEDGMSNSYINNNVFDTALLFNTGATRIDLSGAAAAGTYDIPLLYDGTGKLYMRVRAVNMMPGGSRSDGPWSWVQTYTFKGHNDSLNWQATTTYAEEGKRKTVIQYYDGSLRARQTVTKDNTTQQTVVAETMYDMQGRPAVQILPAPGINNIIAYTKNLNKFNGQNDNTNPADYFDFTTTSLGNYGTTPLNDSFGTARYYSAKNPGANAGYNKDIPAAGGYPYAVTRYTADATGRIMRQSGVGDSLSMGSGHEARYYYGTPAPEELDALFGTEAGNYTHYFKNMVRDANGQMSISYVDMHGRTIATALAGDATPGMQALAISDTNQYRNQAGTTLTRNLLTRESNTVKGNSIESINTILAPLANTNYTFAYTLKKQTLTLPACNGGTVSYNCKFDLEISVTDESGDHNPIVYTYKGIDTINFKDTIQLSAGSYSVRKTLTINPDSLAQFMAQYNADGVGLCQTQQQLIDSIAVQDSTVSGCGIAVTQLTCASCLATLGDFNTYLSRYASSMGKAVVDLSPEQVNDIRTQYQNDSALCISLNANRSHTLENIREQMLADMVPYSGQYASNEGSGTMYNKYNIFSTAGASTYTQPFYKYPKNEAGSSGNYHDAFGNIDVSIPAFRLQTMVSDSFEAEFSNAWAASLLPYHPEFSKLKFAENSLQSSFDFIDSIQLLAAPIELVNADPFFSIPAQATNKSNIIQYSNVGWPAAGGYSMWQLAYGDAFGCKTYVDFGQRNTCYNNMPKQLTATGAAVNINSGTVMPLSAAIQAQAWNMYKAFYGQVRGNMVNQYINLQPLVTDTTDNRALMNQGFKLYFPYNDVQTAQNNGWNTWYPNDQGNIPTVNLSDSVAKYGSHCDSYIDAWRQALLQCPALANHPARETILNSITSKMVQVCKYGTDGANPYGSSTVAPAYINQRFTSFEQVVFYVLDSAGIDSNLYCHPYGIEWPKPYSKNPTISPQYTSAVDTCTCSQWAKLKTEINNAGFNAYSLTSVNRYLSGKYHDTITAVLYNSLQQCGLPYLYKCKDSIITDCEECPLKVAVCDTAYALPLAGPQPLPLFLNCGFDGSSYNCYSCSDFKKLDTSFYAIFHKAPVFTGTVPDSMIAWNNLFARYVNFKTGLQHNWQYYAAEFNATGCAVGGINGSGAGLSICLEHEPLNDTTGLMQAVSRCDASRNRATLNAAQVYDYLQQQAMANFKTAYQAKCIAAAESFTVQYALKEYHYTLYYYDQAGNLVKTVPPKGVQPLFDTAFTYAVERERQKMEAGLAYTVMVPQHSLVTRYCYNSLNQVVLQKSPDGGKSSFWYDRLGRLAVSQNAKQAATSGGAGVYSYTKYDLLGRITEVGQITGGTTMSDATAKNDGSLQSWYTNADNSRSQVTQTIYDIVYPGFTGLPAQSPVVQRNLRNRVSYMQLWNNATDNYPASATYYTYDIHGNVDTLLQDFGYSDYSLTANAMNRSGNRFKKIVYDYDLISGKVNQVSYQPGQPDAYYHRYVYDAENRLTDVYSGRDSVILLLFPEREAHYDYYKHGPLARTTLGQLEVQKQDYVYTLQGWLKGVNPAMGGTLANGTDTTEGYPIAQDAYAFSLHYFKNDYKAIGYTPQATSVLGALGSDAAPLFNGNIAAMAVNIPKLSSPSGGGQEGAKVYNYHYDQLNRLVAMDAYNGLNAVGGTFTPDNKGDYRERISYDPNGNILTYNRHGDATRLAMDSLSYFYTANTNRLHKVVDAAADASDNDYSRYNDIKQGQTDNNYQYDEIGNLVKDSAEGLSNITWNVYGKITSITKSGGVIRYVYNPNGERIMKQTATDTTVYVRDATGNVLSVYTKPAGGNLSQTELHLYGSSRLGMATQHLAPDTLVVLSGGFGNGIKSIFTRGEKLFELSNHLGNVLVTVSDKKIQHGNGTAVDYCLADVINANDYYPFGILMPGRSYLPSTGRAAGGRYRYGFNGKENDNDVKGAGNQQDYGMRIYDPRLGRFLSVDPITRQYPQLTPYQFASNSPIGGIDRDGLEYMGSGWLIDKLSDGFSKLGMQRTAGFVSSYGHSIFWDPAYSTYQNVQKFRHKQYVSAITDFDPTGWTKLPEIYQVGKAAFKGNKFAQGQVLGMIPSLYGGYKAYTSLSGKNAAVATTEAPATETQAAANSGVATEAQPAANSENTATMQTASKSAARKNYAKEVFSATGKPEKDINSLMETIDFNKPVREKVLGVGEKVYRYEKINGKEGEMHFYTDAYGADAGATSVGFGDPSGYKLVTYEVTKATTVMESTIRYTKTKQFFSTELQNNVKKISEE